MAGIYNLQRWKNTPLGSVLQCCLLTAPLRAVLVPEIRYAQRKHQQRRDRRVIMSRQNNAQKIFIKFVNIFFKFKILAVTPSIPVKSELSENDQIGVISETAADGQQQESESNCMPFLAFFIN